MEKRTLVTPLLALLLIAPAAAAAEQPRPGGILTWFVSADPGRLDIHAGSVLSVQQATAGVWSGLLHYDPDEPAKITPDLAERWTGSPDGTTYTFHLRRGVRWHDGQPFSAADVKATFDRILSPDFHSPRCGAMLKPMVSAVEVIDPHTVALRLKFPAAPFIAYIASAWCRIAAKHILERYGDLMKPEAQIGTGPFKFKRYERGSIIEWERNRDYFIRGLPYLDGVKQFVLVGAASQLAAAKVGRVMLWDTYPPMTKTQADELRRARGDEVQISQGPVNMIFHVYMNARKPPFDNADLRRAVNLALDRQELVGKGLEGAGVACALLDPKLAGDFALPVEEVNSLPGCRQPKAQDMAEAKRLVEKHYPNGVDAEAAVRVTGNHVDRAQLVLAQLRKIGIRGTLKSYESAAGTAAYGKGDFTLIAAQDRAMVTTDPNDVFALTFATGGGMNFGRWSDPKVDALVERGLKERSSEKRRQIYHELQRYLLTQDTPTIAVGWVEGWFFQDRRVRGYKPAPTIFDNNTFMRVWLAQ